MMNIAWIVPGGIGQGESESSNPVLTSLFSRLSSEVQLTAFSFSARGGSETIRLRNGRLIMVPVGLRDGTWERWKTLSHAFARQHREARFDLVHGFWALPSGGFAALLGRLRGIPSVSSFLGGEAADLPALPYGNMVGFRSRLGTKLAFRLSTAVHLLTMFQRDALEKHGMSHRRARIIPLGADAVFNNVRGKAPTPPYRLLHVSNLTEVKDQTTLLNAFKRISDQVPAILRVAGPDFLGGKLQRLAVELSIDQNVQFLGHVPHALLPDQYAWAQAYLHTSLFEGQSVSVLEAMASGLPVCGTRVGILADLPQDFAIGSEPGDPVGIAHAVIQLLLDTKRYEQTRVNGRDWAIDHSMEFSAREILRMYRELAGGKSPA